MGKSKIEWCARVWNPVTGCTPISEGCEHCYAQRMANRLRGRCGYPEDDPFRVVYHPDKMHEPLRWKRPQRIFAGSMTDFFYNPPLRESYSIFLPSLFDVIEECPQHTFMILTKRPENMLKILCGEWADCANGQPWHFKDGEPLPNLWLGVTAENQARADERIPILLQIPAAKRFVSIEPMLGPVDLSSWDRCDQCGRLRNTFDPMNELGKPWTHWACHDHYNPYGGCDGTYKEHALDWVILGGETGPGARPINSDWVRSVRDQCQGAGVPFFFKQWGEWYPELYYEKCPEAFKPNQRDPFPSTRIGKKAAGHLLDGKEYREFPK